MRACAAGEVQTNPETCTACPASSYSFNTSHTSCDACPPNANCTGGANLIPAKQYWHSSPDSDYIIQCPNNYACLGDRNQLLSCKNASYALQAGDAPVGFSGHVTGYHCSISPSPCLLVQPGQATELQEAKSYAIKQRRHAG